MALSPQEYAAYAQMQQVQSDPYLQAILRGPALNTVVAQRLTGSGSPVSARSIEAVRVPGQAAREVPVVSIGTHDDATGGSLSGTLGRLSGAGQSQDYSQPFSEPSQDTGSTAKLSSAAGYVGNPYATGEEDHGWLGNLLPAGVSNFVSDAATGMAYADPREPASMAFGKAFAGAQASNTARLDRKRADQNAAAVWQEHQEDKTYEHGRDTKKDDQWQKDYDLKIEQEKRANDTAFIEGLETTSRIDKNAAEIRKLTSIYAASGVTEGQMEIAIRAGDRAADRQIPRGQLRAPSSDQMKAAREERSRVIKETLDAFKSGRLDPDADPDADPAAADSPAVEDPDIEPASPDETSPEETPALDPALLDPASLEDPTFATGTNPLTFTPDNWQHAQEILEYVHRKTGRDVVYVDPLTKKPLAYPPE